MDRNSYYRIITWNYIWIHSYFYSGVFQERDTPSYVQINRLSDLSPNGSFVMITIHFSLCIWKFFSSCIKTNYSKREAAERQEGNVGKWKKAWLGCLKHCENQGLQTGLWTLLLVITVYSISAQPKTWKGGVLCFKEKTECHC